MKLKLIVKNGKAEVQNAKTGEVLQNVANVDYSESMCDYPRMTIEVINVPKVIVIDTCTSNKKKEQIIAIDHAWRSKYDSK